MSSAILSKPLLVGMNNPQGNRALVPYPVGCTGYRIYEMLHRTTGCFRIDYMTTFDRINVLNDQRWSAAAARANREAILTQMEGRTAVLMGRAVPAALGLPPTLWDGPHRLGAAVYDVDRRWTLYYLPHPSGLNRWYNDIANRDAAASLLTELYTSYRLSVGLPLTSRRAA